MRLDQALNQEYTRFNRRPRRSGQCTQIDGVFFCLLMVCLLLAACTAPSEQSVPLSTPETATPGTLATTEVATATLPSPTKPTYIPTHTPLACLSLRGTVEVHEIRHPALVAPLRFRVYLPPCYERDTYATFPTLLLLHGLLATDIQWDDFGVDELADHLIQSGTSPPFIILMPWIRNSQDPHVAVTDALIPYAQMQWRLHDDRGYWAIGGISRGAGQALQIGLLHPERFGAIGLHSPAILQTPELLTQWGQAIEPEDLPAIWLDIGDQDSLQSSALNLIEQFQQAGIPIEHQVNVGDHTSSYWIEHLPSYMAWYSALWTKGSLNAP